ncbi:hypothetical protein GIB67_002740 [Kingdonia uniflora]|uniref:Uncharacterized protein n=1 Tax=Kingdonia uniflora TaxID=39325 RepID=A0A7J7N4A8_9MAGN|nr:hypothetical protein GIB67_002740 [Kingdonia uniflora]
MKSDKEVNEQVDEENQTQEGRAKKGTSNAKNYTSRCTGLGLHKMFAALPEEEKGVLRVTCFAPLLLIDSIATMSMLVVEIFDRHLEDVLRLNLLKIILSFLLPNKGRNVEVRYQIEAPAIGGVSAIGVPAIGVPAIVVLAIGSSSSATETGVVVVRQVAPGEILEVTNALMVDDNVEVGRDVNFNTISSEYGGDLLEWKKDEEKDNDDKKDVEEKVKSDEEEVQEMEETKNGDEKVDDVAEEQELEQPTLVVYYTEKKDVQPDNETMVVAEVVKTDIVFFNQEEVIASVDQTTAISVEEQTLEVEKAKDEAYKSVYLQTKKSKEEVEQNKEEVFEGKDDDDGNSQNKPSSTIIHIDDFRNH